MTWNHTNLFLTMEYVNVAIIVIFSLLWTRNGIFFYHMFYIQSEPPSFFLFFSILENFILEHVREKWIVRSEGLNIVVILWSADPSDQFIPYTCCFNTQREKISKKWKIFIWLALITYFRKSEFSYLNLQTIVFTKTQYFRSKKMCASSYSKDILSISFFSVQKEKQKYFRI